MSVPTPDSRYLTEAQNFWTRFTKAVIAATAFSVATLALMAITLL